MKWRRRQPDSQRPGLAPQDHGQAARQSQAAVLAPSTPLTTRASTAAAFRCRILLARFLAEPCVRERLPGPFSAELAAVGAAHDALGAVRAHHSLASHAGRTSCNPRTPSPSGTATAAAAPPACRAGCSDPCARPHRECCRPDCGPADHHVGVWCEVVGETQRHHHRRQARLHRLGAVGHLLPRPVPRPFVLDLYWAQRCRADAVRPAAMAARTFSGRVKARYSCAYSGGRTSTIVWFSTQTSITWNGPRLQSKYCHPARSAIA
jgi:hypothetical protein